jgi:tRNA(Ile)-lysidine synthase
LRREGGSADRARGAGLVERIARDVAARGLIARGDRGLVALSGGPDSLCLLAVLQELAGRLELTLGAASIDHGLRPGSGAEAEQAVSLAGSLGVPARVLRLSLEAEGRGNLQQRARRARLACLEEEAARSGACWIALGHTADDQAETLLMRIARGTGLAGLGGIAWRRGPFIRPLLATTRVEIERELEGRALSPVRDPSNQSDRFLRNRIRRGVLPLLARENPEVVQSICRLAEIAREESEAIDALARASLDRARSIEDPGAFRCDLLREIPAGLVHRALRLAVAEQAGSTRGIGRRHLRAVAALCADESGTRELDLPGLRAERSYGLLRLVPRQGRGRPTEPALPETVLEGPGARVELPGGLELRLQATRPPGPPWPGPLHLLCGERARFPLIVRGPRPGDRIRVGPTASRKVARVLLDAKIPRGSRRSVPLLTTMEGEVIAVLGVCLADGFRTGFGDPSALFLYQLPRGKES